MKIVAFLQNQWFKDPERIKATIARTIEREAERDGGRDADGVRDFYIASFLFFGCLTGKRLRAALGEELCDEIIWQEQSPEIGGKSSAAFPPDFAHIEQVLQRHQPTHVLAFGKMASDALRMTATIRTDPVTWKLITGPHPAARHATVMQELRAMREKLLSCPTPKE